MADQSGKVPPVVNPNGTPRPATAAPTGPAPANLVKDPSGGGTPGGGRDFTKESRRQPVDGEPAPTAPNTAPHLQSRPQRPASAGDLVPHEQPQGSRFIVDAKPARETHFGTGAPGTTPRPPFKVK